MSRTYVDHGQIVTFAENKVNLRREDAAEYRKQVWGLRDKLDGYLRDHPDFSLRKMMLSGSLAKGTALKTINDIDVAMYVCAFEAPTGLGDLIEYLAEKLRAAFPNFSSDQVQPQTYSVKVSFKGTGLDVDVVPILYDEDPDWRGQLVSQDDGSLLETSIPLHLEFCRTRKAENNVHFAQVVRLAKFWATKCKAEIEGFRFKSFMIELVLAHLSDTGAKFSDYPEALQTFFTYLAKSDLRDRILFSDYYPSCDVKINGGDAVQIVDPVNCENNVARLYTRQQADMIVSAAIEAGDAVDWALSAPTKGDTVLAWQKVFGPSFSG